MNMALSKESIEKTFSRVGIVRGRSLYLNSSHAIDFVKACDANDLAVVRIEAIELLGTKLHPRLDLIADYLSPPEDWAGFSWRRFLRVCNTAALDFISRVSGENILFYLIAQSRDDIAMFRESRFEAP
jgi:hypothetical protein